MAQDDEEYRNILSQGDIQIVDGVGIAIGGSILGIDVGKRVTGVDLMENILQDLNHSGLRVMLLGGGENIAEKIVLCYKKKYPHISFYGMRGISSIQDPHMTEEAAIFSIVADYKPQILFVAFGSPWQEKWIWNHRGELAGVICMGVGGGFDFVSGKVARAPHFLRSIGLEWFYRLMRQPWRVRRQIRLIRFMLLIFKQKFF